jgi:serine/threonine protein kinase
MTPEQRLPAIPGYEIIKRLGGGGMGVVYAVRRMADGHRVALKMIKQSDETDEHESDIRSRLVRRFHKEVEAVSRLRHPNIVEVYENGEQNGLPFFTMELVEGGNLDQDFDACLPSVDRAAELLKVLALAMHYAHGKGIIHRDLKPANVLLTSDRTPKIGDFGLARCFDQESDLTRTGEILGTPPYMAPEVARGGTKEAGVAADVYSLGAILYKALTARPPFEGSTAAAILYKILSEPPPRPATLRAEIPRELEAVCLKCLAKEPARRYSTAEALASDLQCFLERAPIAALLLEPTAEVEHSLAEDSSGSDSLEWPVPVADEPSPELTSTGEFEEVGNGPSEQTDGHTDEYSAPVSPPNGDTDEYSAPVSPQRTLDEFPVPDGYEILKEIGRGGLAVVYKARQVSLNRIVALKIPRQDYNRDENRERYRIEAAVLARLRHPNVVQIYGVGEVVGLPYIIMEFLEGYPLYRILQEGQAKAQRPTARLLETLARALDYVHRQGVTHRCLSPRNIMLTPARIPIIIGFDLARSPKDGTDAIDGEEAIMGVPLYMAPEQAQGKPRLTGPPADVFSLGVILYRMLTGSEPFRGYTQMEVIQNVITKQPEPPGTINPEVHAQLDAICMKCLEKDPSKRYASAAQLAQELHRFDERK